MQIIENVEHVMITLHFGDFDTQCQTMNMLFFRFLLYII